MSKFEEEMTWILGDFKNGRLNYAETILKVEQLIDRLLGFSALNHHQWQMMEEDYKKKEPKP